MHKDLSNDKGVSTLISAVRENRVQIVRDLADSFGVSYIKKWCDRYDLLHRALQENYKDIAELLLLNGAKVDDNYKFIVTPLHYAATYGHVDIAEMLLDRNAQIEATDVRGRSSLHYGVEKNHIKVVKFLLSRGASVNTSDRDGITPLHIAAVSGRLDIVETLIKFGAKVDTMDECGRTPLHIAYQLRFKDMIGALLWNGSDINIRNNDIIRGFRETFYISECSIVIVRHIAKLMAGNLFVKETYLQAIDANRDLREYYIRCEREIREMKTVKICNTNVSFYDILTKGVHQLAIYARNENIVEVFRLICESEYAEMFPIYLKLLKKQFREGQERQILLKSSIKCINSLFGYDLPNLFTDEVFSYLSNLDLINLINAYSYDI